jgi:hypothetical protein
MDTPNIVRSDLIEQCLVRGRELVSGALARVLELTGRPEGVPWDVAAKFVSDYVLLPLVVVLVLLFVVRQALND